MAAGSKRGFSVFSTWLKTNQITVINASVTVILLLAIVVTLLIRAATLQRETTEESIINLAGKTASEIQSYYLTYYNTVDSIAEMMTDYEYVEVDQRRRFVNDILIGMLNVNRTIVSVYSVWNPNVFGDGDENFRSTIGSDETGQFLSGFTRERGWVEQRTFEEYKYLLDIDFLSSDAESGIVSEPVSKLVSGFGNVWIFEIQIPIFTGRYFDRRLVGVVGATINLRAIQSQVELILPYETGHTMLCSASGTIVAHSDPALQGLKWANFMAGRHDTLFSIENPDELFNSILASIYDQEHVLMNTGNSVIVSYPMKINALNAVSFGSARTDSPPWAVVTAVPMPVIMAPINTLLRFSLLFIIGAGILAAFVIFLTSRSITQQTRNLQRALEHSATIQDNLKYGLFLIDQNYTIQGGYSKALENILSVPNLQGKNFIELLASSIKGSEQQGLKDYLELVFKDNFDRDMLERINPLNDFTYISTATGEKKELGITFTLAKKGREAGHILTIIEDITKEKELERQLAEAEDTRENEMRSLFQVIQLDPKVLGDFVDDAEYEFGNINAALKNKKYLHPEVLVQMYQSIHAVKANAIILNLENFAGRLHTLEATIKGLRETHKELVPFDDFLALILELNEAMQEMDQVKATVSKIENFRSMSGGEKNQERYVLVETLTRVCDKTQAALDKKVRFAVEAIDDGILDYGPRRVIKEMLTQLVRNAVYHGIESPAERVSSGKEPLGEIRLSMRRSNNQIVIKLADDGAGIDFDRIRHNALASGVFGNSGEANNRNNLLKAIFSPGFSTLAEADLFAGRGIGLSLVRDRVKELRGNITVSTAAGKGTTFTIYIPLELPAQAVKVS